MISGFYLITSNNQLSVWMENKLQSTSQRQTCAKKRSWSLFGGLISYSFLSPGEAVTSEKYSQQIDELHGKLQGLQPAVQKGPISSPRQDPITCCTTNTSKVEQFGLWSFSSSTTFTWPHTNQLPLLQASGQLFAGKMLPQPEEAENAFQESVKSQSVNFYATAINKLISHWQKCIDRNGSHFD